MTPLERWDARWQAWYRLAIQRGKTPNQAIPIADRLTTEQHGDRPEQGDKT